MAASKKNPEDSIKAGVTAPLSGKRTGAKRKVVSGPGAPRKSAKAVSLASIPAPSSKVWMVPVAMLLILAAAAAFLINHARYLASLKFDMVRTAAVIPQGHDVGQGTGIANFAGDQAGHLFMLESDGIHPVRLQRFDPLDSPDALVYKGSKRGQDLTDAVDVDCDPKGNVIVLLKDGRVQFLDNNLNYLKGIQTGLPNASAASVNSAGRMYIADTPENKVVYFDATGRREGEFGAPGKSDFTLATPVLLRVTLDDEVVVVENTPLGLRGRIFTKVNILRKTFLVDRIQSSPWVRLGVNSQRKAFFNDQAGSLGIVCWDLVTGKYFGSSQTTKDSMQFVSPGCLGANRYTPDVYVHTVPGLIRCVLPAPSGGSNG